jgi:methylglutaconyl-CoA hydratase
MILASETDQAFCAGADLKERAGMSKEEYACVLCESVNCSNRGAPRVYNFLKTLRHTFSRLASLPIPTISAINSSAFGGGLELGLCTHFRVLASTATVALPETRLAIIPGAGGTYRLPSIIGATRARDLILTGRRIQGPESYFIGLADRLVEITEEEKDAPGVVRGKVLGAAVGLARDICEGGPVAIRAAMQAVDGWQMGEQSENKAYELTLPTEDRVEALRAFAEKRKPVFKGR